MNYYLNNFLKACEDIPNKNAGGCLFFVYAFWLYFKDNNQDLTSFRIIQYDASFHRGLLNGNKNWIIGNQRTANSGSHFTWLINDQEFDAEGSAENRYSWYREILDINPERIEEFCLSALNDCQDWNSTFYRKRAIDKLEKRCKIDLSRVSL